MPANEAEASLPEVRRRLEIVAPTLPLPAQITGSRVSGRSVAVDQEASLHHVP